ncbi:hypothetical protein Tco_1330128 [Tanacetum coccineum]
MGDENPIRTLGDYSRPSHKGYRNTIEIPDRNNVVPLRSDTILLVQNECSFHKLQSEDLNQHLKDFLKLVYSLDLNVANRNAEESWELLEDLALYDNESWNNPRDFTKPVKAISLPQDIPSTSDRRLIELENQVQCLMEAHLAPKSSIQVNKIASSCEICGGLHDTQYCMENPEQAFVDYASSRTNEVGGKWYTFKPEQNNLGDTYNPSWKSHPNLRWRQPQNSQNNFSNPPNRFQPNGSIPNCSFNNNPQYFKNQSNLKGLVSNFMTSQDARLSKFETDFKQQQSEMTNKIDTFLKAINDQMTGALPSDTVKNPKLSDNSTSLVLSALHTFTAIPPEDLAAHAAWVKGQKEVVVLMLLTMDLDIQRNLAHLGAYDMLQELKAMFSKQAEQELLQTGLRGSRKLKPGALSLYVGDGHRAAVEAIGTYHLELPSGLVIV